MNANLSKNDRLQIFAELACFLPDQTPWMDPSDPDNIVAADKWFREELTFLDGRDKQALREVWQSVIDDCRNVRILFSGVKTLQEKYNEVHV